MERYGSDKPDTAWNSSTSRSSQTLVSKSFLELLQLEVLSVLPIPGGNEVIPTCGLNRVVTCSKKPVKLVPRAAYIRVQDDGEIDTIGAIKDNLSEAQKQELQPHKSKRVISCYLQPVQLIWSIRPWIDCGKSSVGNWG